MPTADHATDAFERIVIERACERLALDYARLADFGPAAHIADLFAEDGVCDISAGRLVGREAIREFFERRDRTPGIVSRHVCTNITIDMTDSDHAAGTVYLTFYRVDHDGDGPAPLPQPSYLGHYRDEFIRTDAGWRILSRVANVGLKGAR
jgi:hypothetical protein